MLVNVPRAAARANLTQSTICDYIRSGRLRATKFGRAWRISPEDLDAFLAGGVS
jgi:excisionase family DNA binding protein